MKKKVYALIVLFLSFCAIQTQATNYYADPSNANASDDNAGTDPSAPWATLNPSVWSETGGTINLAAGNYYLTDEIVMSADVEIVGSSKDEVVILSMDDEDFMTEDRTSGALPLTGKFFTTVEGSNLTVRNVTVKNLRYGNAEGTAVFGGMFNTESGLLTLQDMNIINAIVPVGGGAAITAHGNVSLNNVLVQDCVLGSTGDAANAIIFLGGLITPTLTMEKVHLLNNNASAGSVVNVNPGADLASAIYVNNCTAENNNYATWGALIRGVCNANGHNLTYNITNSFFMNNVGVGSGACFIQCDASTTKTLNVLLQNNTFFHNYRDGFGTAFSTNDWGGVNTTGTVSMINNSFIDNTIAEPGKAGAAILYVLAPAATFNFINNLAMVPGGESIVFFTNDNTAGIGTFTGNITESVGGGINALTSLCFDETTGNYLAPVVDGNRVALSTVISFGDLVRPQNGDAPYIPVLESSYNIDKGISNALVTPLDARGAGVYNSLKDVGAYEYNPDFTVSVKSLDATKKISAYPNPFTDVINLSENMAKVVIYNINGVRTITKSNVDKVNVSNLNKGMYLVRATAQNGKTYTLRMIK